VDSRAFLDAVV